VAFSLETRTALDEHRRGGDVFDAYDRADGSSTIFLGDVSSKGALGIARAEMLRRAFRASAGKERSPASIMADLNAVPFTGSHRYRGEAFASIFIATVSSATQAMSYASAGHDTALILTGRAHRHLAPTGPVIGVIGHAIYSDCDVAFGGADVLLIATDGFTECRSNDGQRRQFGTTGIVRSLAAKASHSHRSASRAVAAGADAFTARRYDDDATLAAIARVDCVRQSGLAP
jgi:sigma-B regulation protein RsbU (phosphoserine phosphatase)